MIKMYDLIISQRLAFPKQLSPESELLLYSYWRFLTLEPIINHFRTWKETSENFSLQAKVTLQSFITKTEIPILF